jgi:hypothetical protein
MNRITRLAALAGIIGPLLFGGVLLVLKVIEYDFMRSLGWEPLSVTTVVCPSGLALGPFGYVMTAAFLVNGLLLGVFALGLGQTLPVTTASRAAATLMLDLRRWDWPSPPRRPSARSLQRGMGSFPTLLLRALGRQTRRGRCKLCNLP